MRKITGETRLLVLLGNPVSHSLSPIMHNAALEEMGINWCYLAIPCETNDLETITSSLKRMDCKGINITIPHKKSVLTLCNEVSKIAKEIQAVNTLIPHSQLNWRGTNTDIEGFLEPLYNKNLQGKNAVVLGSGGSARAIVAGLRRLKLKNIIVLSRRLESLNMFLQDANQSSKLTNNDTTLIKGIIPDKIKEIEHIESSQLIVNTTPIGMKVLNEINPSMPFGEEIWHHLKEQTILYDLIYNPRPTHWLKLGSKKNCVIIDGLEMLVRQGAASLKLWSGYKDIPIETMKIAAINHLNGK